MQHARVWKPEGTKARRPETPAPGPGLLFLLRDVTSPSLPHCAPVGTRPYGPWPAAECSRSSAGSVPRPGPTGKAEVTVALQDGWLTSVGPEGHCRVWTGFLTLQGRGDGEVGVGATCSPVWGLLTGAPSGKVGGPAWARRSTGLRPLSLVLAAGRSKSAGGAGAPSHSPRAGSAAALPTLGSSRDCPSIGGGVPAQLGWIERSPVHLRVCHPRK